MTSAKLVELLNQDLAAGILAAADLRERRAKAATQGLWLVVGDPWNPGPPYLIAGHPDPHFGTFVADMSPMAWEGPAGDRDADAEHIAAEANPAHALAAVARWRGVVERHTPGRSHSGEWCIEHLRAVPIGDCPDLRETATEVRAYLQAGAQ